MAKQQSAEVFSSLSLSLSSMRQRQRINVNSIYTWRLLLFWMLLLLLMLMLFAICAIYVCSVQAFQWQMNGMAQSTAQKDIEQWTFSESLSLMFSLSPSLCISLLHYSGNTMSTTSYYCCIQHKKNCERKKINIQT